MKKVYDFLKKCKTFYVATIDGDQPRVRPFGVCEIIEDKLYFSTSNTKPFWKQITKNPNIEICAYDGQINYLRVSAKAIPDSRNIVKDAMLKGNPHLEQIYKEYDKTVILFYISQATATFEDFNGKKEIIKF
ncbi:MAG: pyridoxamine 5'-phosphate oxidase family protein [Christensenellaceae bacterium]|jgi:uncharacterized pyridoxamine 5'-phosphate oxidase family protein|nr:pyridoxamine 5'-phosphate oxidase family protein [Christensenellaceae bacterium]